MTSPARIQEACELAADAILAAVLAPQCVVCSRSLEAPLSGPVCATCWSAVRTPSPPLCRTCGVSLLSWRTTSLSLGQCARCRRAPSVVDVAVAAGEYEGSLRDVIHAFKYDGRRSLARPLGEMMRRAGSNLLVGADCAVPVPLHPWRRLQRGFNQADDLARRLGVPVIRALRRPRATPPQATLTAAARRRNVRVAFAAAHRTLFSRIPSLRGRVVVLVDDVRTTGATLDSCARVLKSAGVVEVRALTAARASSRAEPSPP